MRILASLFVFCFAIMQFSIVFMNVCVTISVFYISFAVNNCLGLWPARCLCASAIVRNSQKARWKALALQLRGHIYQGKLFCLHQKKIFKLNSVRTMLRRSRGWFSGEEKVCAGSYAISMFCILLFCICAYAFVILYLYLFALCFRNRGWFSLKRKPVRQAIR